MSSNPIAPLQRDDAYEEEYVINRIAPHYGFVAKFGCLSNHFNQSRSENIPTKLTKANNYRSTDNTREQNAISSLDRTANSDVEFKSKNNLITLDAKTIDSLEKIDSSKETTVLIERWRNIVKPGVYRLSNGKWKKYHEPKFLRCERKTIEERLTEIIRRLESPAVEIRNWSIQKQQKTEYFPDWQFTEARNFEGESFPRKYPTKHFSSMSDYILLTGETPMEEGEISNDSELAPSVLEYQPLTGPTILEYRACKISNWVTHQEYMQWSQITGTTKTPSEKLK